MTLAAPFPYFGGKRRAAPRIWEALGDPSGYVEPFAGSAAVLLAHGWTVTEGKAGRGAGYSTNSLNGRRERLWLSPACVGGKQIDLFGSGCAA